MRTDEKYTTVHFTFPAAIAGDDHALAGSSRSPSATKLYELTERVLSGDDVANTGAKPIQAPNRSIDMLDGSLADDRNGPCPVEAALFRQPVDGRAYPASVPLPPPVCVGIDDSRMLRNLQVASSCTLESDELSP